MSSPSEYKLTLHGKFVDVAVRVNDLPVLTLEDGGSIPNALINHWVIEGHNTIQISARLPAQRTVLRPEARVDVRVQIGETTLYAYAWQAGAATLPWTESGAFQSGAQFGAWSWQNAPRLELSPERIGGINALAQSLHRALSSADVEAVVALLRLKNEEMSRAFGLDAVSTASRQRRFFEELFAQAGWAMAPLDLTQPLYPLFAEARVVGMRYQNERDVIRSTPDEKGVAFAIPLFLSLIDHQWRIVR